MPNISEKTIIDLIRAVEDFKHYSFIRIHGNQPTMEDGRSPPYKKVDELLSLSLEILKEELRESGIHNI